MRSDTFGKNCGQANSLALYMKDVKQVPLLAREEENALAVRAKAGDVFARNKIVSANLRFVMQVAKRYVGRGLPYEDLISEGNVGLLTAIDKFNPDLGYHFISYAVHWISQSILKALGETSRTIRLPANKIEQLQKVKQAQQAISHESVGCNEIVQIAKETNLDENCVKELISLSADTVSLDSAVAGKDGEAVLSDFVADCKRETPEDAAIYANLQSEIESSLQTLAPKEADVLRHRFGLNGNVALSLKELGDRLELSKERVRQIEKKAIARLKKNRKALNLAAFVA